MGIDTFVIVNFVLSLLFLILTMGFASENKSQIASITCTFTFIIIAITIICIIIFAAQPWQIENTISIPVDEHGSIQFIAHNTEDELKFINVNKVFGRRFEVGEEIDIVYYKTGPYAGFYTPTQQFEYKIPDSEQ